MRDLDAFICLTFSGLPHGLREPLHQAQATKIQNLDSPLSRGPDSSACSVTIFVVVIIIVIIVMIIVAPQMKATCRSRRVLEAYA